MVKITIVVTSLKNRLTIFTGFVTMNCNTVWFKINLTLFETDISHKLSNIMNLFWKYLETRISWKDVVKVASKLMLKYWNWSTFRTNSQFFFLHTCISYGAVTIDQCTTTHHALTLWFIDLAVCMMIPRYKYSTSNPTRLHRLCVHAKWFLTICQKRAPISLFQHQFWCHFCNILPRYHTL